MSLGSRHDSFDVNDASGIALLPKGTLGPTQVNDYAFVTGWNRLVADDVSRDPFLPDRLSAEERAEFGYTLTYPAGGNVGVIEDPFGPAPTLIAATIGGVLSLPDGLTLSPDGRFLYAAYSANNQVKVFDVREMVHTLNFYRGQTIFTTDGQQPLLAVKPLDVLHQQLPATNPSRPALAVTSLGTGRFPQALAVPTLRKITLVGPVESSTDEGTVTLSEPIVRFSGDTTPKLLWQVTDLAGRPLANQATTLYVSVFDAGQGLFPTDKGDANGTDLASHRIVNGIAITTDANGLATYTFDSRRALTVGQTYHWGVRLGGQQQFGQFKLEAPAPTDFTRFSSVTVLTHGFQPVGSLDTEGKWLFQLAEQIVRAGGGDPGANILVYRKETGNWEDRNGSTAPVAGGPLVLIPNWWTESKINDSGFSEAAADAFFASLVSLDGKLKASPSDTTGRIFNSPLHFIAHSRGTVVTSELLQRLGEYEDRALHRSLDIQFTTLDVHDELNGPQDNLRPFGIDWTDFNEPIVKVWENVDFADNYYQDLGTKTILFNTASATPNGRAVVSADVNVHLNGLTGFLADDADFEGDIFAPRAFFQSSHTLLGPHSRVWRWYAGTANLNIDSFEQNLPGNEPVFRSAADAARFSPSFTVPVEAPGTGSITVPHEPIGGGGSLPWYVPRSFSATYYDRPSLTADVNNTPWEGIGVGWWYSTLGGGGAASVRPPANIGGRRVPLANDNTSSDETPVTPDQTVWGGSAIPTLFNGNFEAGNMRRGSLNPVFARIRGENTPGWSLHQRDFNDPHPIKMVSYTLPVGGEGHAAELDRGASGELVHNRFYIPLEAQFVQFDYNVQAVEYSLDSNGLPTIPRQPHVNVFVRVDGAEHFLGKADLAIPSSPHGEADFIASSQIPIAEQWRGKVGELILRLSVSPTEPPLAPGQSALTRVWIDNVRLGPTGAPLQAESQAPKTDTVGALVEAALAPLVNASMAGWRGLVDVPNGGVGVQFGSVGVTAPEFSLEEWANGQTGNTGVGERGFNDQFLLADMDIPSVQPTLDNEETGNIGIGFLGTIAFADQLGLNGDPSLAADSHAVQAQYNSSLLGGEQAILIYAIVDERVSLHPEIADSGAAIDGLAIPVGIADFDVGRDFAAQGGHGAIADLDVLQLEKLSLQPFETLPSFGREREGLIKPNLFFDLAPNLAQGNNDNQQQADAHRDSSVHAGPTVARDPASVKPILEMRQRLSHVQFEVADLPGTYLALTRFVPDSSLDSDASRVTHHASRGGRSAIITIDQDAAGYGWFVDPTPSESEEFAPSALSPQLSAAADSPATGKIDLLTTIYHELGHAIGLGHAERTSASVMRETLAPGTRVESVAARPPAPHHQAQAPPAQIRIEWAGGALPGTSAGAPLQTGEETEALPSLLAQPAAWLHQFLFDLGRSEQERDPTRCLEIVLPGADERR